MLELATAVCRFNRTSGTFDVVVKLVGTGRLPCGGRPVQVGYYQSLIYYYYAVVAWHASHMVAYHLKAVL